MCLSYTTRVPTLTKFIQRARNFLCDSWCHVRWICFFYLFQNLGVSLMTNTCPYSNSCSCIISVTKILELHTQGLGVINLEIAEWPIQIAIWIWLLHCYPDMQSCHAIQKNVDFYRHMNCFNCNMNRTWPTHCHRPWCGTPALMAS